MSELAEPTFLETERARTLIGLGRFDEAASKLHQLLGQDPENSAAWCLLAQAQLGRHDAQAALEAANRAVAAAPESSWAHRLRSIALRDLDDHDEAIAAAYAAIKWAPNDWQGYSWLAGLFSQIKSRRREAMPAAEYGVALAPHESRAYLVLGAAAAANGKRKEAEDALRRALAIDPQNSDAHNALARLNVRQSRFGRAGTLAEAAGGFQAAVRADPRAAGSSRNLELVLRVFLSRLTYLILIGGYFYVHIPASSPSANRDLSLVILFILGIPTVYGWRFVSRLSPDLRRHLRYTLTHGRVAIVSALQLLAILLLLYAAVASPASHGGTAAGAFCLTLVARLLLIDDIHKITGVNGGHGLLSTGTLWLFAAGFALIAVLFGLGAAKSGFGTGGAILALISGALCLAVIYLISRRRA
jgi:tetratricopeptide (TPR) repeat protein